MPTRRTLLILSVTAPLFMLAGLNPAAAYAAITIDALVLTLFLLDRRRVPSRREVGMVRRHLRVFSLAEPNLVRVTLTNRSPHPLNATLQDNPPAACRRVPDRLTVAAPAHSRVELGYDVIPLQRGRFRFHEAVMRARGPLGLALREYRFSGLPPGEGQPEDASFSVYPSVQRAAPRQVAAFARHVESGYHRLQREVEGTTPSQIRRWSPGDSYRDICWKATARYDQPMVMQYDTDRNQTVYVFVDCGRLMRTPVGRLRKLDYAVSACADLARVAIDRGDMVGLCCFSAEVTLWHEAKGKRAHLRQILASLATVRADARATDYHAPVNMFLSRAKKRCLCLFLTSLSESQGAWELMRRLRSLRPRHVPAVISLIDPEPDAALGRPPRSLREASRKLAWLDLREEAQLFAQELRRAQGYFLEAPADSLSLGAVQTYLGAKSRGLL